MRGLPRYAVAGLILMPVSQAATVAGLEPFATFHTPIVWTGYILFVDGVVWRRRGNSWLRSAPAEFLFLAVVSVPLWLVFEFYNLFIQNWHYVGLPEDRWLRLLGYGWAFATIWPAVFETGDLVGSRRDRGTSSGQHVERGSSGRVTTLHWLSVVVGAGLLTGPVVWPSPYLAAPIFLGFIFLLDPVNARLGGDTLLHDSGPGRWRRCLNLAIGGAICGVLWELWNYWAGAKWIYTVPIMAEWKLFEMPLPGYLGFPAFALECFTMYVTVRLLIWRGARRAISI